MRHALPMLALAVAVVAAGGCDARRPVGDVSTRVQSARDLGPAPRDLELTVVLGLELRNRAHLADFLRAQPESGDVLAPADFADRYAVAPADYARVLAWLEGAGVTVTRASRGRTSVSIRGSTAAIEAALAAPLHQYADAHGTFVAAAAAPRFPYEIARLVSGSVGLGGELGWRSHRVAHVEPPPSAVAAATTPPALGGSAIAPAATPIPPLGPAELRARYHADGVAEPGAGQTIAILGTGTPPDPVADVRAYVTRFGLPVEAAGRYRQVLLGGPNRDPDPLASDEYAENTLDVDMVLALAPHAEVVHVLTATNVPGLFTDGIAYIVDELPRATTVSVSYGSCERGAAPTMPVLNALFAQAKAQGQQWLFASGDSGADGCRDGVGNQVVAAGWPGSSPYVVSVGGTELDSDGSEIGWHLGGGAPSESFDKPPWQAGAGGADIAGDGARDTPDVAALAGFPGVATVTGGKNDDGVGGTSAAAPMWAAVWALLCQARGGGQPLGLERLYQLGQAGAGHGLVDITAGHNVGPSGGSTAGGYAAGPGYDRVTGLGSPDVAALITSF